MSKVLSEDLDKIFGEWYIQVSKPMIKIFGLEAAVMLCNLYSEYRYWKTKGKLTGYGTFYSTVENVEHNTGLGKRQQLRAIEVLETYGIIKKSLHDLPPKRYFRFLEEGVKKLCKDVRKEIKKDKERKKEKMEKYGFDDVICYDEDTGEVFTKSSEISANDTKNVGVGPIAF